jgi:hypothetical protein
LSSLRGSKILKKDQKSANGSLATADRPDSGRKTYPPAVAFPLKGQHLSFFIDVWLIEKEGQFFKSTQNTYRKAISDFLF